MYSGGFYPRAVYACLNRSEAVCPRVIKDRSVCIDGDLGEVLKRLLQHRTDDAALEQR